MPNNKSINILGIDPGYDRLGIAIVAQDIHGKDTVVHSECFTTNKNADIHERLRAIGERIEKIFEDYVVDVVAMETLFITKNQKTAMRVAEARGIIIYEAAKRDISVFEYSPMQIKTAITSDGTSDKTRMIKMVHMLVNVPPKKLDDEYDAIAVALTHSAMR